MGEKVRGEYSQQYCTNFAWWETFTRQCDDPIVRYINVKLLYFTPETV